jgi:hypothetical protein
MPELKVHIARVIVRVEGDPDADDESAARLGVELTRVAQLLGGEEMTWKRSGETWCGYPETTTQRAVAKRQRKK